MPEIIESTWPVIQVTKVNTVFNRIGLVYIIITQRTFHLLMVTVINRDGWTNEHWFPLFPYLAGG